MPSSSLHSFGVWTWARTWLGHGWDMVRTWARSGQGPCASAQLARASVYVWWAGGWWGVHGFSEILCDRAGLRFSSRGVDALEPLVCFALRLPSPVLRAAWSRCLAVCSTLARGESPRHLSPCVDCMTPKSLRHIATAFVGFELFLRTVARVDFWVAQVSHVR